MLLSFSCLGADSLCITSTPPVKSYPTISFYGESSLYNVKAINVELSNSEIESIDSTQERDFDTLFLAGYGNSLEAGNLTNNDYPIVGWRVRRKASTESLYTLLAEINDPAIVNYIDYTANNGIEYTYTVYSLSSNNNSEGQGVSSTGMTDFWGWILTDGVSSFLFDVELNSSDVQIRQDYKVFETYQEFPVVRFGNRLYKVGDLSTIPYYLNENEITIDISILNSLETFINNKQVKTLKNSFGENFLVVTTDMSWKHNDPLLGQLLTVKFSYTQVG